MLTNKQAFTLIELLVVVLIIGILAAVALPQYQVAVAKTRYSELMSLVKHVKTEQEVFYLANGHYAENCEELGVDVPAGTKLNTDKNIVESKNRFTIKCLHGGTPKRVLGALMDATGSYFLHSYEQSLDYSINNEESPVTYKGQCWADKTQPVYVKVCKNLCGYIDTQDNGNFFCQW